MTTTDAELDALVAQLTGYVAVEGQEGLRVRDGHRRKAASALTAIREENAALREKVGALEALLGSCEDMEKQLCVLLPGFVGSAADCIKHLISERDRLRTELDATRKVVEDTLEDIKCMVVTQAQLRAVKDDRTQAAARHEAECNVAQYATQIHAKMRALTPEKPDAE